MSSASFTIPGPFPPTPYPVIQSLGLYLAFAVMCVIWYWAMWRGNYMNKDSFQILTITTVLAVFFLMLLWLCAWMHQWHPLIVPQWGPE